MIKTRELMQKEEGEGWGGKNWPGEAYKQRSSIVLTDRLKFTRIGAAICEMRIPMEN